MDDKSKWAIILVAIIVAITTATVMNSSHQLETVSEIENTIDIDNGDLKINWGRYQENIIELQDTYTITKSGIYHLTGKIDDGMVQIKISSEDEVKLILDNVVIKKSNGPAIMCTSGDDLVIELIGENYLSDGESYDKTLDEDITGTIYSKADLTFQGSGTLDVKANYADGIVSKDDLKFNGGTYNIIANDDGIRGKDSVYIVEGNFNIASAADAIKSTNDKDSGKGFVLVENTNMTINAKAKGIKATRSVFINGGYFVINSSDDSIHSDDYIGINGGTINLVSSDDGIHANREINIDGGGINISKSYEGIEAQTITINDGNIKVSSTDDGINAGGGTDNSANNRPGASPFNVDENCIINLNGGSISINASGDGVDSNGWLYINGGRLIVDGPTSDGNGALDASADIIMNGGEALAIGSSGMAETLGNNSKVNNVSIYLSETMPEHTAIAIKDSKGDTIFTHTPAKPFSHIAFGSPDLTLGETFALYLDDELAEEFTITDITTTIGRNILRSDARQPR